MPIFYTDTGSFDRLEVSGSTVLSGSLIISGTTNIGPGGLTGSLFGTASAATTASYALTASVVLNLPANIVTSSGQINTGSFTGSFRGDGSGLVNIPAGLFNIDRHTFVGNGTNRQFTLSGSYNINSLLVTDSGLTLIPFEDYTISSNILTLVTTPQSGSNISVAAYVNSTSGAQGSFTGSFLGSVTTSENGFPFNGSAIITGSLLISQSISSTHALRTTGSVEFLTGSTRIFTSLDDANNGRITLQTGGDSVFLKVGSAGVFIGSDTSNVGLGSSAFPRAVITSEGLIAGADLTYGLGTDGFRWNRLVAGAVTASSGIITTRISASSYTSSLNNQVGFLGTSSWAQTASYALRANAQPKSISIYSPSAAENITMFYTQNEMTVSEVRAVIRGGTGVSMSLQMSSSRAGSGVNIVNNQPVTSTTLGNALTIANATIPADTFVWLSSSAVVGTVNELHVTMQF